MALVQAEMVKQYISEARPELIVRILPMTTAGDRILNRPLDQIGGKGLFVKELDQALAQGRIDLSVHSLKDVPMDLAPELPLVGFSVREDPRDVLVLPDGCGEIDFSKPVGCSSVRRMVQFKRLYPQARFKPIRGNVQTRLRRLDEGQYGATILAAAGLKRLGLEGRISRYFSVEEMIPAAGQGILAVQGRADESYEYLGGYTDEDARLCALSERAFIRRLGGGCTMPAAAYAEADGKSAAGRQRTAGMATAAAGEQRTAGMASAASRRQRTAGMISAAMERQNPAGMVPAAAESPSGQITLRAMYLDENTGRLHEGVLTGSPKEPEQLGTRLAEMFLAK